jgi:integrase
VARNQLTAIGIKSSTKAKLSDGDGLWLHTSKAGGRYWVFMYTRGGRRREMGLGPLGTGTGHVSLAAARVKADEIRTILGRGGDPFTEMAERRARLQKPPELFGDVADAFIDTMQSNWRGRATAASWRRFATTYAKSIRNRPISEVNTEDVLTVLRPLWKELPETGAKARERMKIVLDHAKARGLRTGDNPAEWRGHLQQMLPAPEKLKNGHHAAMPYSNVPDLVPKLRAGIGVGVAALEFTILTAARSGEAREAVWSEIDLDKAVWEIPASRMKSGKDHRVPLVPRSLAILREMQERGIESAFVFPGANPKRPISDATMSKALRTAGGQGFTVHGFRSSFRDWASEETEHQREVAEAALAHAVGDATERAYRRGDALEKRRALMADWANFCGAKN